MDLSKQAETACIWQNTIILIAFLLFPLRAIFHFCLRLRNSFYFNLISLFFFFLALKQSIRNLPQYQKRMTFAFSADDTAERFDSGVRLLFLCIFQIHGIFLIHLYIKLNDVIYYKRTQMSIVMLE